MDLDSTLGKKRGHYFWVTFDHLRSKIIYFQSTWKLAQVLNQTVKSSSLLKSLIHIVGFIFVHLHLVPKIMIHRRKKDNLDWTFVD